MSDGCLRKAQRVTGRINSTLAFWLITLTYVILGLLEVDDIRRKIQALAIATPRACSCTAARRPLSSFENTCWSGRR